MKILNVHCTQNSARAERNAIIMLLIIVLIYINKLLFLIIFNAVTFQLLGKLEGNASETDNEKAYIESKSWYLEATILCHSSFLVLWSLVFSFNVSS